MPPAAFIISKIILT